MGIHCIILAMIFVWNYFRMRSYKCKGENRAANVDLIQGKDTPVGPLSSIAALPLGVTKKEAVRFAKSDSQLITKAVSGLCALMHKEEGEMTSDIQFFRLSLNKSVISF